MVLRRLGSGPRGLTEAQAQDRLDQFGENAIAPGRQPGWLARLLTAARGPFVLVLSGLVLVSAVSGDVAVAAVIATLALASPAAQPPAPVTAARAARPVLAATVVLAVVALVLPLTPLAAGLGLRALPLAFFPLLAVILAGYCLATTAAKAACLRGRTL